MSIKRHMVEKTMIYTFCAAIRKIKGDQNILSWKDVQDIVGKSVCRSLCVAWKRVYNTHLHLYAHRYI